MQQKTVHFRAFGNVGRSIIRNLFTASLAAFALFVALNCPGQSSNQVGAASGAGTNAVPSSVSDPLLQLMIQKGIVTAEEAEKVRAEADAMRQGKLTAPESSKWKLGSAVKEIELYGDIRLRYENRRAYTESSGRVELERYRYSLRLGLRGQLYDDFYFGVRMDTSGNPRSAWSTFGTSSSGFPYNGPFGKSTGGINVGQLYLGWKPASWFELTAGKMPNPFYTTPMTWDSDLAPEGLAERFRYTVGPAEFFSTFGQFIYQDTNPNQSGAGLIPSAPAGASNTTPFLLGWQLGVNYKATPDISFKTAVSLYNYTSDGANPAPATLSPGFGDTFVGEGAFLGPGSGTVNGASGFPNGGVFGNFNGFAFNQTGINDLLILDIPFEVNFKVWKLDSRLFGDFAENLQGNNRSKAAFNAASSLSSGSAFVPPLATSGPQLDENKAYQLGIAVGNNLGLVTGSTSKKNTWEVRTYYQHVEQYALDPNLLDSDFFEGRGNLQGIYTAFAYSFADGMIGTLRYGYGNRINKNLGTGGSNQDIPWVNPINRFQILQFDLTYRF